MNGFPWRDYTHEREQIAHHRATLRARARSAARIAVGSLVGAGLLIGISFLFGMIGAMLADHDSILIGSNVQQ